MQRYLELTWSIIRGDERIYFKVLLKKSIARYIMEKAYVATPKLTEQKNGSHFLKLP